MSTYYTLQYKIYMPTFVRSVIKVFESKEQAGAWIKENMPPDAKDICWWQDDLTEYRTITEILNEDRQVASNVVSFNGQRPSAESGL
jgi:hypothetical protein